MARTEIVRAGCFPKGVSGNPGGRPRKLEEVRRLAQIYSIPALKSLFTIGLTSKHVPSRVAALKEILDRAIGRAPVSVTLSDPDGGPVRVAHDLFATLSDDDLHALRSIAAKMVTAEPVELDAGEPTIAPAAPRRS